MFKEIIMKYIIKKQNLMMEKKKKMTYIFKIKHENYIK